MDLIEERDKRWSFGITLPAVAEAMDEEHLTSAQAMELLQRMLGPGEKSHYVLRAIRRLAAIEDEGKLRLMLGEECLRALDLRD